MLTTIRKVLESKNISVKDTVYATIPDSILDFPIKIGDFFKLTRDEVGANDFVILKQLYFLTEEKKKNREYEAIRREFQRITARLKEMKGLKYETGELTIEKTELRSRKKRLGKTMQALEEHYLAQSIEEIKKGRAFGPGYLKYKDVFNCSTFSEIVAILPQVAAVNTPKLKEMPLFVRGMSELAIFLRSGGLIGIVGGPCLFGVNEVTIEIYHRNGELLRFDFSSGREYNKTALSSGIDLESHLKNRGLDIKRIEFTNLKKGVTFQEYLSMLYLFEFARVLGAKIVIPIPDMSYMKFFNGVTKFIADEVKEPAAKVFEKIAYDIADLYLAVIEQLKARYPEVECQVLHNRNLSICELFYKKRQQYIKKLSQMGRVTIYDGKVEAIIDYISMLALPYYVYGTRNVLQIDSVDEADSMRKCMKIHNPDVNFYSILYPEYLARDGINTVFTAPLELKDYIRVGG